MKKRFAAWLLCLSVFLLFPAGCLSESAGSDAEAGWSVYYAAVWENGKADRLLDSRAVAVRDLSDPLPELLRSLLAEPDDEHLNSAFPSGTRFESYSLEDGQLTVHLSAAYGELSGWALSLADACAVLTLCNVPDVRSVRLTAEGEPQAHRADRAFSSRDFITDELTLKPVERLLTLYFVNGFDRSLTPESRTVFIRENEPAERYVMEELFVGPKMADLDPLIDFDVSLLSAVTENGVCDINLPSVFYQTPPLASTALTLEAIVNSLTELPGVEAVRFWQDGDVPAPYGGQALDKPLTRQALKASLPSD